MGFFKKHTCIFNHVEQFDILSDFFVLRYRKISKFCSLVFVRCQTKFVSNTSWMTKWLWKKFWLVTCEKEKYWLTYKFLVLFVKDKLRRCFILAKDDDTSDSCFWNVWRNTKNMLKQKYGKNVSMTYWQILFRMRVFLTIYKKWKLKLTIINLARI